MHQHTEGVATPRRASRHHITRAAAQRAWCVQQPQGSNALGQETRQHAESRPFQYYAVGVEKNLLPTYWELHACTSMRSTTIMSNHILSAEYVQQYVGRASTAASSPDLDDIADLPVRDGNLDAGKVGVEPPLQGGHKLDARGLARVDGLYGLRNVSGDRLLAEHVLTVGGTRLDLSCYA